MACGSGRSASRVLVQISADVAAKTVKVGAEHPIVRRKVSQSPTRPKVEDFHCGECGLTLANRQPNYRHACRPKELPVYQQQRIEACSDCDGNQGGICQPYKEIHPDRDCVIATGVKIPYAICPLGKWSVPMIRCPECSCAIFDEGGPTSCRYCGWSEAQE